MCIRDRCNVNEMVVTLMLNYAVSKTLEFLTTGVFKDKSAGYVATPTIKENVMFKRFGASRMTMFFVIAMIILVIMYFVMKKSKLGYEITAIGKNPEFAEATGMNVGKKIIIMMLISGALSGVAGAGWMLSDQLDVYKRQSLNTNAVIKGSSLLWLIGFIHHQSFAAVVEISKKI